MSDIQGLFDELSKGWRAERSLSQMTLREMIEALEGLPDGAEVEAVEHPHSYRGYYSDLSFERTEGTMGVKDLLGMCQSALDSEFTGYKGGEFYMDGHTPLWIAPYGRTGERLMGLDTGSEPYKIVTAPEESDA